MRQGLRMDHGGMSRKYGSKYSVEDKRQKQKRLQHLHHSEHMYRDEPVYSRLPV